MRVAKVLLALATVGGVQGTAEAAPITFTKLSVTVGGTPAATAVYVADLGTSGVASMTSITIADNSDLTAGSPGQFSGFDLDAIGISTTFCGPLADLACFTGLTFLNVFDFSTGVAFVPGSQQPIFDPKLFGTGAGGTTVDNTIATIGAFDANSTTDASAAGFLSMGFGGVVTFNLTSSLETSGRYLYIGEVGDNGELAAGTITIAEAPLTPVPEPSSMILLGTGVATLFARRRRAPR